MQVSWRDRATDPWGDADRVVVSGNGPVFVNVLESQAAYLIIAEYDPADCEHVEVRCRSKCASHREEILDIERPSVGARCASRPRIKEK